MVVDMTDADDSVALADSTPTGITVRAWYGVKLVSSLLICSFHRSSLRYASVLVCTSTFERHSIVELVGISNPGTQKLKSHRRACDRTVTCRLFERREERGNCSRTGWVVCLGCFDLSTTPVKKIGWCENCQKIAGKYHTVPETHKQCFHRAFPGSFWASLNISHQYVNHTFPAVTLYINFVEEVAVRVTQFQISPCPGLNRENPGGVDTKGEDDVLRRQLRVGDSSRCLPKSSKHSAD